MNKLFVFGSILLILLAPGYATFSQSIITVDTVLSICKKNAISYLEKKVIKAFGNPKDDVKKIDKLTKIKSCSLEVAEVNSNLIKLKETGKLPKTDVQAILKVALDEYRLAFPDLDKEFYEKTQQEIEKRKLKI